MSPTSTPLLLVFLLLLCVASGAAVAQEVDYARDVAPILRVHCSGCHNDDELDGDLSIETYASLRADGDEGDPIVPGDADGSFLIRSLEGRARPSMPPKSRPRVPPAAIATLRRWVDAGAHGPSDDTSILETLVAPRIEPGAGVSSPVTALAVSADGARVAVGRYGRVEIRRAETLAVERSIDGLPGKVLAVEFSRSGERLVVATGTTGLAGEARLIDLSGSAAPRVFAGHDDVLYDATLSPDETWLATAGYDRVIRIWRAATGELVREIDVHKGAVFDLEFDPEGRVLASASADETVKLWRVADGVRLDTLNQPQGEQFATRITPDGRHVLSVGADRRLHLWRLVSKDAPALNPPLISRFAHESTIVALELAAGGSRAITAAEDGTLEVWSVPKLEKVASFESQSDVVAVIAAPARGSSFFVGRLDGSLGRYELSRGSRREEPTAAEVASRIAPPAEQAAEPGSIEEVETNDDAAGAQPVELPVVVRGAISRPGDRDLFRFRARAGEALTLEVDAARSGSSLDSRIEVLDPNGQPLERVTLQAVRDSWFTFRGKDSDTSDDFRLHNWREMELDQLLYARGEVVRLWLYPRGPDSGFKVYPGRGRRVGWFGTTALSHALGEPCYIVEPFPPGHEPVPNGLPVFRIPWENDDDPSRRRGSDSILLFTAPRDGEYIARVSDVRGFGGEEGFSYGFTLRERRPDFAVSIGGRGPKVGPGSGRELSFSATRIEGFEGPILIDIENLPAGFTATTPVVIEADQTLALGAIHAAADAAAPTAEAASAVRVRATATIGGREVVRELGDLGEIALGPAPKITVEILPLEGAEVPTDEHGRLVFELRPGETLAARVRTARHDFGGRIELGKEDSGRNLPFGLFVDNIGLNGLLVVEGQTERDFFITAAPIARPTTRLFHLRATADGGQCSLPAVVRVLPPAPEVRQF